jgi:hypothetical protein
MGDRRIGARRGVEDTVVVKVPTEPHAAYPRTQRGCQRDVNEVAALALLILHSGR